MESRRHTQATGYPSITIDEVVHANQRRPLSTSAGNGSYPNLASTDLYHEQKGLPTPIENTHPRYSPSGPLHPPPAILPSQNFALQPPCASTLERRKSINRKRRVDRHDTHFIVESPQYQQYRLRQVGHDNPKDQKWPEDLEMAFLDAQVDIPKMGRRKFSYKGKPHGRNELISEYLWIAHIKSLAPGQKPDKTKSRTRKQVSSHIQVLKGYMRQHPAYDQLFKTGPSSRNPFQDSFKDDPCLKALAKGELPPWRRQYWYHESRREPSPVTPVKDLNFAAPENFHLWISRPSADIDSKYDKAGENPHDSVNNAWHTFTIFDARARQRENLEVMKDWRLKFPQLAQIISTEDLRCDIIHMDVSLMLPDSSLPKLSSLCALYDIFIPGTDSNCTSWHSLTVVDKQLKYRNDHESHPQIRDHLESLPRGSQEYGTRLRVPFPVTRWAHKIQDLMGMQQEYEDGLHSGIPRESLVSTRDYIEQIAMYQEIYSRASPTAEKERRAIILWTFHKGRRGKPSGTYWRHLDGPPSRRTIMSPPPSYHHPVTASINEYMCGDGSHIPLDMPGLLEAFGPGLTTPPNSGPLQSPFMPSYPSYVPQTHDVSQSQVQQPQSSQTQHQVQPPPRQPQPPQPATHAHVQSHTQNHAHSHALPHAHNHNHNQQRHLSFMSTETADSDSTLVEQNPCAMDNFLNGGSFSEHPASTTTAPWLAPPIESFTTDPHAWSYDAQVPVSSGVHHQAQTAWDAGDLKHAAWGESEGFAHEQLGGR